MAGDWIKMRCNLASDPDVIAMAAILNRSEFEIVGQLHAIWSWADQHSANGVILRVPANFLDRLTHCPDFSDALRCVGWLEGEDGNLQFPHFERHNGDSAKARALESEAKRIRRTPNLSDTASDKCPTKQAPIVRPEKRREEKSTKDIGANGSPPALDEAWISELSADKTYDGIDVRTQLGKMKRWCAENRKQPTRRRFVNWLNRADRSVETGRPSRDLNI